MIWKFLKQNVLSPKGLNWVQHLVSRIGLLLRQKYVVARNTCLSLQQNVLLLECLGKYHK